MVNTVLRDYLGMARDMEMNLYTEQQTINNLISQTKSLAIPSKPNFNKPVLTTYEAPNKPLVIEETSPATVKTRAVLFAVISIVITIILFKTGHWGWGILGGIVSIGALANLFPAFDEVSNTSIDYDNTQAYKRRLSAYQADTAAAQRKYESEMKELERNTARFLEEDKLRVEKERVQKEVYETEIASLTSAMNESRKRLDQFYSLNIVHPKYRNLPMICTLYEYIEVGRYYELEGTDGAYNALELELRLGRIISTLGEISTKLDRIQQNQYSLYTAVSDCSVSINNLVFETQQSSIRISNAVTQASGNLSSQLNQLQQTSAITAYQTTRTQQELAYLSKMLFFSGEFEKAGIMRKLPPSLYK